jgi:hypothetical protein
MLFAEILHRTRPVNIGQQAGVAEAHPPQHLEKARKALPALPIRAAGGRWRGRRHSASHGK